MNSLRYAIRFLGRQKTFTVINMLGLALSLACSIILTRYLYREATVEKHCIDPSTIIVPVEYFDATMTDMHLELPLSFSVSYLTMRCWEHQPGRAQACLTATA